MVDLLPLVDAAVRISYYCCYGAMAIHFLNKKNNSERLRYLIVVAGVFAIVFMSMGIFSFSTTEWNFSLTQMAIIVWLAFNGIPMMLSKEFIFFLFLVYFVSISTGFFFSFLLGTIAYLVVIWGFIFSALAVLEIRLEKAK